MALSHNFNRYIGLSTIAVASLFLCNFAHCQVQYSVLEIENPFGGESTVAYDVNDSGEVVGSADTLAGPGVVSRAIRWKNGVLTDLGTLGSGTSSAAYAINNNGEIVGEATNASGILRPVWWTEGQFILDLGDMDSQATRPGSARDINDNNTIVGYTFLNGPLGVTQRAFRYRIGFGMDNLGTLGGYYAGAYGIQTNSDTVAVGEADTSDFVAHGCKFFSGSTNSEMTLGTGIAQKINASGTAAGWRWTGSHDRAVRWVGGTLGTDLLPLIRIVTTFRA